MANAGIVDAPNILKAEFAAYTKLTLVNRLVKEQIWGENVSDHSPMSFLDFLEAMEKGNIVNSKYARPVSSYEVRNSHVNASRNGNHYFEMQKFNAIQKAYELGLVDEHGILLSAVKA